MGDNDDRVPGPPPPPGGPAADTVMLAAAAVTLGPMITAFSRELGRRLGGSAADWLEKIHLRPRRPTHLDPGNPSVLQVNTDGRPTLFEVSDEMSDEAKLALIEIDMAKPEIRGHRLRWDGREWLPAD